MGTLGTGALLAGFLAMWLLSGWIVAILHLLARITRALSRLFRKNRTAPPPGPDTAALPATEHTPSP